MTRRTHSLRRGSPARVAALLAALAGVALFAAGMASIAGARPGGVALGQFPGPLVAAILLTGFSEVALALLSLRAVRVAWAFALSLNGTAAVILLFAVPKLMSIGLPVAVSFVPTVVFGLAAILFAIASDDFAS